jgi:hypothetical protein
VTGGTFGLRGGRPKGWSTGRAGRAGRCPSASAAGSCCLVVDQRQAGAGPYTGCAPTLPDPHTRR